MGGSLKNSPLLTNMIVLKNPIDKEVRIVFEHVEYKIPPNGSRAFRDEDREAAKYMREIYDFVEVERDEWDTQEPNTDLDCQYGCGFTAKTKAGKAAHERHCVAQHQPLSKKRTKPVTDKEVEEFGNTDGLSLGEKVREKISGRVQEVTYDREGVGWYGPGLEKDHVPVTLSKKTPGDF